MYNIDIKKAQHEWDKQNLVTLRDRKGAYDAMICRNCGIKGKRRNLAFIEVSDNYSHNKVIKCKNAPDIEIPLTVRVKKCTAVGSAFSNMTPGSVHNVIEPPKPYKNDHSGVWVQGVGEPVKLLPEEFIIQK